MTSWVDEELSTLRLGDARRESRVKRMVAGMADKPEASLLQTFKDWADAKAAYRALSNEAIRAEAIRQAATDACVGRVQEASMVFVIQDTTSLDFSTHRATQGTGPLGGGDGHAGKGFWVHSALAVSDEGVPLGLLHQKTWARDPEAVGTRHRRKERPIQEKESFRWIETLRAVHAVLPARTTVVHMADQEADIFELFVEPRPENAHLLIRVCHNRRVAEEEAYLTDAVESAPMAGEFTVTLRRNPERGPREARLAVRFRAVTVQVPRGGGGRADLEAVGLTVILVTEVSSPPVGEAPIRWLLATDLAVADLGGARECVQRYALRWLIERYHYTLKSGCKIEQSQLRTVEGLERLLALYGLVAWRLLWLTYAAREHGEQPCTVAFSALEWQTLHRLHNPDQPLPDRPPPLRQVVRWTASLGGFLGRTGDGEPGVKVLWRGLMCLQYIIVGVLLARPLQDVGKG
jgi:hypothetical protein